MIKKTFEGSSVEQCLKLACSELKIKENELRYKIIEEKKGFFKKKAIIEVEFEDNSEKVKKDVTDADGTITVESGKIVVNDPKDGGKAAVLIPSVNAKLIIDDKEVSSKTEVFSRNKIEAVLADETSEPVRKMDINISNNNMKAYITIRYVPKIVYKLKDVQSRNRVVLEVEEKEQQYPPIYTVNELKEQLAQNNIKYGVIEENLKHAVSKEGADNLLIARGDEAVNDEDDTLEILFKSENKKEYSEDKNGTVDFKSIGFVNCVNKGAVLAIKHEGRPGADGKDVAGKVTKHKIGKKISLKTGEGCEIKDNKVIAARQGEPSYIGQRFCIYNMHEVQSDVDLKTGNIKFDGDVAIHGEVKEGMEVEAGGSVKVAKSVENAKIRAKGNISIQQNVIFSTILAGGQDIEKIQLLQNYSDLYNNINQLIEAVKQVRDYNLLGEGISNGEIIKALLENRFKAVTRIINAIMLSEDAGDELKKILKEKLVGFGPINIKFVDELVEIASLINNEITMVKGTLSIPVDVSVGYSQNSTIQSSGNIMFTGKGEYVSNIIANGKIAFSNPASVARGGLIKAKSEIRCGTVGSIGAVPTKLTVDKGGNIYAAVAYPNTSFCIDSKECIIDTASKDIHAYLGDDGEITVDKFLI